MYEKIHMNNFCSRTDEDIFSSSVIFLLLCLRLFTCFKIFYNINNSKTVGNTAARVVGLFKGETMKLSLGENFLADFDGILKSQRLNNVLFMSLASKLFPFPQELNTIYTSCESQKTTESPRKKCTLVPSSTVYLSILGRWCWWWVLCVWHFN